MSEKKNISPPESAVGRRDFMKFMGTAALGAGASGVPGASEAAAPSLPSSFPKVKEITLPITHPDALAVTAEDHLLAGGENLVLHLDRNGAELARYPIDGRVFALLSLGNTLLLGFRHGVVHFDPATEKQDRWEGFNERSCVTAVTKDENHIFVADAGNRVVLRYDLQGRLINRIGDNKDDGTPGFIVPSPYFGISMDPLGMLWVINPGRHGVESFRPDGSPVSTWYKAGASLDAFCGCCNPIHIAWRSDHSLVTVEKGLNRVKVYAPDFSIRGLVQGPLEITGLPVNLSPREAPPLTGLAVDSQDRILVLNARDRSISIYEEKNA
ncbi:MAG TPA: hypothetical protein PLQ42_12345 [Candidatus Hydrogenedentes bacterium]|nr:MAG: hypothetical protein BWY07_02427 [Candidatus Hydrogenedentes bacterium ADurb.Bin170]HNZ49150.1 hypothetical protein [Candidatus Hydrogenedentota bacterium]HOD94865.1 hypothetical protein [Candidatus Hydrogenedentota bacterium]HOM47461.1 hypothetical protein [Candidatus Hydrogenedentota bacterium]HOR51859.1 hypothetical protein [Candidatus Hydrogenedentota bacterium]